MRPFCICVNSVIRSSLLLRFHKPAFLQTACLLSADYSEDLYSHRPTFWTFVSHWIFGVIYWLSQDNICINGLNLLSRPSWKSLKVFGSLWNYLKAKEILLCLRCPCDVVALELDEPCTHICTVDKSLLAHDFIRSKWNWNLCWTIPIKNRLSWQFPKKKRCFVGFQRPFLEYNANDVLSLQTLKQVIG